MNLVFDLGNQRFKWALAGQGLRDSGARVYGEDFHSSLDAALAALPRPARAVAVSVAGAARTTQLADWLQGRWGLTLELVAARASQLGVINSYHQPESLGADRWAAMVGARALMDGALCVVDCGTAVTIDALDATGVFRGGVILPGLSLMRSSLRHGTDGITAVPGVDDSCLARNTADAVAAGTLQGLAGAIDHVLDRQVDILGAGTAVFITGGDAPQLVPLLRHVPTHVPDLVLEGVARIAASGEPA